MGGRPNYSFTGRFTPFPSQPIAAESVNTVN
jgi:hypothetical protein